MAWKWPAAAKNGTSEEWTGFIDQGVTLEGTLTVTGTFRIDGNVKGNIISEQTVILGEGAKVEGQIEGNRVVISGRFDGVIFAKGRVRQRLISILYSYIIYIVNITSLNETSRTPANLLAENSASFPELT